MEIKNRIHFATFAVGIALLSVACSGKHDSVAVQNEEDTAPRLYSTVAMSDAKASSQLLAGFYNSEGAWRWTAGKFTALLKTPLGAAQKGGTLSFEFTIPEAVSQRLKSVTLTAAIGGMQLKSESYTSAGKYVYTADVPASMLTADTVKVDFSLDKSLPPSSSDRRELGVIATSVGIASK